MWLDGSPDPSETARIENMDNAKMTEYLQEKHKSTGRLPSTGNAGK